MDFFRTYQGRAEDDKALSHGYWWAHTICWMNPDILCPFRTHRDQKREQNICFRSTSFSTILLAEVEIQACTVNSLECAIWLQSEKCKLGMAIAQIKFEIGPIKFVVMNDPIQSLCRQWDMCKEEKIKIFLPKVLHPLHCDKIISSSKLKFRWFCTIQVHHMDSIGKVYIGDGTCANRTECAVYLQLAILPFQIWSN